MEAQNYSAILKFSASFSFQYSDPPFLAHSGRVKTCRRIDPWCDDELNIPLLFEPAIVCLAGQT
jgi:hypothetical protein